MDALSEVLRVINLDSTIFFNAELSEPWCLAVRKSHVIIHHLLADGRAYVRLGAGERVTLTAGDLITLPHGDAHMLGSGASTTPIDVPAGVPDLLAHGLELVRIGGGGAPCRFICGYLAYDPHLSKAILSGLPPLIKVNVRTDPSGHWLENSLKFSVTQAANREPGAGATLAKLSEAVFAETLRRYVRDQPDTQTGWLAATRDANVGKALTCLHQRYAHPWTLSDLAKEVGVSRTVLSERFRHFLGEPPMSYLTRWRLRLGARALRITSHSVAQIASEAGYESEAAFNRAFKREYGLPPARYRKDQACQKS
jgi:AraC-like DNA-binding protein